jgi:hypothetical protein
MLLIEGPSTADRLWVLSRAREILHSQRWERRYGWARIETRLSEGNKAPARFPLVPGVGVVAEKMLWDLAAFAGSSCGGRLTAASHAFRLWCREMNSAGAVSIYAGPSRDFHRNDEHVREIGWIDAAPQGKTDDALREILRGWSAHLDRVATVRAIARGGWGSLFPRVLFVGERHHGMDPLARPFGEGEDSAAMSLLLDRAEIPESAAHFIHAESATHGDLTWEAVAWLAPRVVVALGERASKYLRRSKVKHIHLPHVEQTGETKWINLLRCSVAAAPRTGSPAFSGIKQ